MSGRMARSLMAIELTLPMVFLGLWTLARRAG